MQTISIRLKNVRKLDRFAKVLNENRSEVVRSLVEEGKKMKALSLYKQKKVSIGLAAQLADTTLSEFMDLLEEHAVPLNLAVEDAKLAFKHAEKYL